LQVQLQRARTASLAFAPRTIPAKSRTIREGKIRNWRVFCAAMTDQRPGAASQAKPGARQQPLRVLIADDDRDGALTLATLLELECYEVRTVHGGQEALDQAREFKPDVALLDIGMPKITGYEAARRLRQRYGHECPVLIAITGWKQASDKILASLAGFDHHVAKPYDPAVLISLLSKLRPAAR
jgi:CheY-like chemotaxis protein